jgi:hypothetical protein
MRLTQATKDAVKNWLAVRKLNLQRQAAKPK